MTFRVPAPVSFILVTATIVALVVFFGAWVVSADSKDISRTLSIGLSANPDQVAGFGNTPSDGVVATSENDPFRQAWDGAGGGAENQAWWEKSLLNA